MKTIPDHPLSPEERELAALTSRLGPHGEPSPALDSRILAAARAAVSKRPARKSKPRWPVAIGLAASVVFAVGIAWQLRPLQQAATVSEAPVAYSRIEPSAAAGSDSNAISNPEAAAATEAVVADASSNVASAPATVAPPAALPAVKPQPVPAVPRTRQPAPLTQANPADAPATRYESRADRRSTRPAGPPPPPAPDAPMVSNPAAEPAPAFVPDAQTDATPRQAAAVLQGAMRSANAATAKQSAPRDEAKGIAAREMESRELDRVEMTGSRLMRTDLQVPVAEDAQLAVEEWLERVRTRYGLGDAGAAKQSLLLFVKDHPGEPIPGDLEPLLEE